MLSAQCSLLSAHCSMLIAHYLTLSHTFYWLITTKELTPLAHNTTRDGYSQLTQRLNKLPQGAPPSELLYQILRLLFSPYEAELVARLPVVPFTAITAAKRWKLPVGKAQNILEKLCSRALLLDAEQKGEVVYTLPPPMAGFFEFSLMRVRGDVDQKLLAELFYQYLNVEDEFVKDLFSLDPPLGRVFVNESALEDNGVYILSFERASEVIKTASHIGVGMCYCRHKMEHVGESCDAPLNICLTFGTTAASLARHEYNRLVDKSEGLELLAQAYEHNLVQCGENVRQNVSFICNCCGCCCEALVAERKFSMLRPVHTTNFLPKLQQEECTLCGKCVRICPLGIISIDEEVRIDGERCLGCGVCIRACGFSALQLTPRAARVITPLNSVHRILQNAIDKGTLEQLVFDNQVLFSHRASAALLGAILKLPPAKQLLASKQFKSQYLESLIKRFSR